MFMVILRAIADVMVFIITLPLRILVLLFALGYGAYLNTKGILTWRDCWESFVEGARGNWNREMRWIKTGKVNPEEIEL